MAVKATCSNNIMDASFGAGFLQHVLARWYEKTGALTNSAQNATNIAYRAEIVNVIGILRDRVALLPV
jgi:hypothetical protein